MLKVTAGTIEIPISDANDLDAVVHELGIEDSDTTPVEAVKELKAELEAVRRNGRELADAADRLLSTTPAERNDPRVWFDHVDALKLAIRALREMALALALISLGGCMGPVARSVGGALQGVKPIEVMPQERPFEAAGQRPIMCTHTGPTVCY